MEADGNQLKAITEDDPLVTIQEDAKELSVDHSVVIRHLKQIGKVKKLSKWVPHELTTNQNNRRFSVKHRSISRIVMCDEKWILQDSQRQPAQGLD